MVRAEARGFAEHVMMHEGQGLGSTVDRGYARPQAPDPQQHERTSEQKTAGAKTVADNFDHQLELPVRYLVVQEDMTAAQVAEEESTMSTPAVAAVAATVRPPGVRAIRNSKKRELTDRMDGPRGWS